MLNQEIRKFHDECVRVNELENKIRKARSNDRKLYIEKKKSKLKNLHGMMDKVKDSFLNQLETQGLSGVPNADLVNIANVLGRYLSYSIKMNAIRRFLTAFRKIETARPYDPDQVSLIRPKLAYAVGRGEFDEKLYMLRFMSIFDPVLQIVSATKERDNFMKTLKFMESIIAYHRFYGGEES